MTNKKKSSVQDLMFDAGRRAAEKKKNGQAITAVEQAALNWIYSGEPEAPKVQVEPKERPNYLWVALTVAAVILAVALSMLASGMSLSLFFSLF